MLSAPYPAQLGTPHERRPGVFHITLSHTDVRVGHELFLSVCMEMACREYPENEYMCGVLARQMDNPTNRSLLFEALVPRPTIAAFSLVDVARATLETRSTYLYAALGSLKQHFNEDLLRARVRALMEPTKAWALNSIAEAQADETFLDDEHWIMAYPHEIERELPADFHEDEYHHLFTPAAMVHEIGGTETAPAPADVSSINGAPLFGPLRLQPLSPASSTVSSEIGPTRPPSFPDPVQGIGNQHEQETAHHMEGQADIEPEAVGIAGAGCNKTSPAEVDATRPGPGPNPDATGSRAKVRDKRLSSKEQSEQVTTVSLRQTRSRGKAKEVEVQTKTMTKTRTKGQTKAAEAKADAKAETKVEPRTTRSMSQQAASKASTSQPVKEEFGPKRGRGTRKGRN